MPRSAEPVALVPSCFRSGIGSWLGFVVGWQLCSLVVARHFDSRALAAHAFFYALFLLRSAKPLEIFLDGETIRGRSSWGSRTSFPVSEIDAGRTTEKIRWGLLPRWPRVVSLGGETIVVSPLLFTRKQRETLFAALRQRATERPAS